MVTSFVPFLSYQQLNTYDCVYLHIGEDKCISTRQRCIESEDTFLGFTLAVDNFVSRVKDEEINESVLASWRSYKVSSSDVNRLLSHIFIKSLNALIMRFERTTSYLDSMTTVVMSSGTKSDMCCSHSFINCLSYSVVGESLIFLSSVIFCTVSDEIPLFNL